MNRKSKSHQRTSKSVEPADENTDSDSDNHKNSSSDEESKKKPADSHHRGVPSSSSASAAASQAAFIASLAVPDDVIRRWSAITLPTESELHTNIFAGSQLRQKFSKDKKLYRFGIPHQYRPLVWELLIDARLNKSRIENPKYYSQSVQLAKKSLNESVWKEIRKDIPRTIEMGLLNYNNNNNNNNSNNTNTNSNNINSNSNLHHYQSMENILSAFVIRSPLIGYAQSMSHLVAFLLYIYNNNEERTFWIFISIIENFLPRDYYSPSLIGSRTDCRVLKEYIENSYSSKFSLFLSRSDCDISLISLKWFLCIYLLTIPLPLVIKLWDQLLYEGNHMIFTIALNLIEYKKKYILNTYQNISVLGNNNNIGNNNNNSISNSPNSNNNTNKSIVDNSELLEYLNHLGNDIGSNNNNNNNINNSPNSNNNNNNNNSYSIPNLDEYNEFLRLLYKSPAADFSMKDINKSREFIRKSLEIEYFQYCQSIESDRIEKLRIKRMKLEKLLIQLLRNELKCSYQPNKEKNNNSTNNNNDNNSNNDTDDDDITKGQMMMKIPKWGKPKLIHIWIEKIKKPNSISKNNNNNNDNNTNENNADNNTNDNRSSDDEDEEKFDKNQKKKNNKNKHLKNKNHNHNNQNEDDQDNELKTNTININNNTKNTDDTELDDEGNPFETIESHCSQYNYIIHWSSNTKSNKNTQLPLNECKLYYNNRNGNFQRWNIRNHIMDYSNELCFSLIHPLRSLDLMVLNIEQMNLWKSVLNNTHLIEIIDNHNQNNENKNNENDHENKENNNNNTNTPNHKDKDKKSHKSLNNDKDKENNDNDNEEYNNNNNKPLRKSIGKSKSTRREINNTTATADSSPNSSKSVKSLKLDNNNEKSKSKVKPINKKKSNNKTNESSEDEEEEKSVNHSSSSSRSNSVESRKSSKNRKSKGSGKNNEKQEKASLNIDITENNKNKRKSNGKS